MSTTLHGVRRARITLIVLALGLVGCSSSTQLAQQPAASGDDCVVAIGTAGASVCPGTGEPLPTVLATTTTVEIAESSPAEPPQLGPQSVSDCVEYVPIGAYLGDQKATDLWNFIGQDASRLQQVCAGLAQSDPATLLAMSTALATYKDTP
ncbi:MAG: hypothetical protein JWN62_1666 [Acidimicrobiales bacterium]|nr:hypothetical protein [Acidimicrobiales bacterium]